MKLVAIALSIMISTGPAWAAGGAVNESGNAGSNHTLYLSSSSGTATDNPAKGSARNGQRISLEDAKKMAANGEASMTVARDKEEFDRLTAQYSKNAARTALTDPQLLQAGATVIACYGACLLYYVIKTN